MGDKNHNNINKGNGDGDTTSNVSENCDRNIYVFLSYVPNFFYFL